MDEDLGQIVHRMERRKGNAAKWSLKTELLQYRDGPMRAVPSAQDAQVPAA